MVVARGWRRKKQGVIIYWVQFQFGQMKCSGDGWWWWLQNIMNVPNASECTHKRDENGNFYVMCILPQLKIQKNTRNDRKGLAEVKAEFIQFPCNHII